ncbi:hypothetical protein [Roseiflexus sp.]|uniref:hypothetical protein n=1 Tax=Roseiflexus sp. TaxID=2562120 RepID=UPI0021DC1BB8|nr:hypothetical protein [Roseiflexus sp.]GIW01559.1 MAG: hypothetical protein KatS3mg058_2962 [Roseiflexus sp.]
MKLNIAGRLHPTLNLLDEGCAIYRRHFTSFVAIGLEWLTPIAIAIGVLVGNAERIGANWLVVIVLAGLLLAIPLALYLIGGLSRAAVAAIDGRAIDLREALAIHPLGVAKAGCFTIIYGFIMQVASSAVSLLCVCPVYVMGLSASVFFSSVDSDSPLGITALAVFGLLLVGMYVLAFIIGGISYSSLFYALQPWLVERLRFGEALERSVDLIIFRFRSNLVAWGVSALLVFAVGLSVSLAVGVIVPLPAFLLLGAESTVAQAIASIAWLLGLALVLPPWFIWMALLYRRNLAARSGADLTRRVEEWARAVKVEG